MEKITEYIQDGIISLLLSDEYFLNLCKVSVPENVFDGKVRVDLCRIIYDYYDVYKTSPKDDLIDFINNSKKRTENIRLYKIYLKKVKKTNVNKKYIISKLIEWLQYQQITAAVIKSAELIKENRLLEVKNEILSAFGTKLNVLDIGKDFWDYVYVDNDLDVVCKTGISTVDKKLKGYCRAELFLWLGATNVGKSWALVDGAISALAQGKFCVYYTLEMSTNNILKRLGMAMTGLRDGNYNSGYDTENIIVFSDGTTQDLNKRDVFTTKSDKFKKTRDFFQKRKGKLIVKEGIEGKWSINSIHAHLNQLEMIGCMPDIIFIDYADLLVSDRKFKNRIDEIDDVFLNLRGLAKERNICCVSATQGTRQAIDARHVGLRETSQSIGKAKIADVVITLNQTREELRNHEMRLFAAKVREGTKYWSVLLTQALEVGSFCIEDREIFEEED